MLVTQRPHDISLPRFSSKSQSTHVEKIQSSPRDTVQAWIDRFATVLASNDTSKLATLFHEDSWWRDHLALGWDLRTIHGLSNIISFVDSRTSHIDPKSFKLPSDTESFPPSLSAPIEGLEWTQSMFFFETTTGRVRGFLRLAPGEDGTHKAHMLYTALDDLKGHEEKTGSRRALGGKNSLEGGIIKGNWFERRQRKHDFTDEDPQVVIIGAGKNYDTTIQSPHLTLVSRSSRSQPSCPPSSAGRLMSYCRPPGEDW